MRAQVFTQLALTGTGTFEVSQAVSMNGANAAQVDCVLFALTASATVTFILQESNDLENWSTKATLATAPTAVGYSLQGQTTAISTAYVRLKATLTGSSPIAVLSAGINTAAL